MVTSSRASAEMPRRRPRILIVGGLSRLQHYYRDCLGDAQIKVANANSPRLKNCVGKADAVVMIVPHVSHAAADRVRKQARQIGVPVVRSVSAGRNEVSRLIRGVSGH